MDAPAIGLGLGLVEVTTITDTEKVDHMYSVNVIYVNCWSAIVSFF